MKSGDLLALSAANLGRRKVRTGLTVTGVVIGVGALVLMVSLGIGIHHFILSWLETDVLMRTLVVSHKGDEDQHGFRGMFGLKVPLTGEDLEKITAFPEVISANPDVNLLVEGSLGKKHRDGFKVSGMVPEEEEILRKNLVAGRLWEAEGECLLPSAFIEKQRSLTPEGVLGRELAVRGQKKSCTLQVVGVYESRAYGALEGGHLMVPFRELRHVMTETGGGFFNRILGENEWDQVVLRVRNPEEVQKLEGEIKALGYSVLTVSDLIGRVHIVFFVFEAFLVCIGAIGLIVSLFGIANTMAMAVMERTREIGIMKALGARNRVMLKLFLFEAAGIGMLGGSVGLLVGWLGGVVLDFIAHAAYPVPKDIVLFRVSPMLALGSLAFAVLVSLVAGTIPAMRASRLDPVRALRYE